MLYHWVPTIPAEATIYPEELSSRRHTLPRFTPEFVMGQLESEENLAQLRLPYRSLVVLIAETGLRAGDACALPFDPLLTDSAGWPCLRFASSKMRAEHLLPLSTRAVEAIRAQQHHVRETCPDGSACARALGPHLSATPASLRARRRAAWLGSPSEITGRGSGEVMVMKRSIVVRVDVEPREAPAGPVSRSGSPRLFAVRFAAAAVPVWSGTPAGRSSRR